MKGILLRILLIISIPFFTLTLAIIMILAMPYWILTGHNLLDQRIIDKYLDWYANIVSL